MGQRCWRWPASGKVILPYSSNDGGNKGIDIAGTRGQPVYAAGAGKVVYVGSQLRGYGNLIMIKHSDDYISAYAHNDKMMVNNGQSVKIGQQIATMGSTDAGLRAPALPDTLSGHGHRSAALFTAAGQ
nr:putative lipoprotein [Raoultella sp. NCTC 9187]